MSEANVEVVRRLLDAARRDDLAAALSCLDPDLEWVPLRAETEGTYRGHRGYEQFVADTNEAFEIFEPHFELDELGEQVLASGTIHVRGRGSGIDTEIPVGGIFDFRAGKVLRWRDFGSKERALEMIRGASRGER